MPRRFFSALIALFASIGTRLDARAQSPAGFWSMGGDLKWNRQELDAAFTLFQQLKEIHGDRFNFVVQDLRREGTPRADGTKTAQILIKIYVNPPDPEISRQLERVGMVFVRSK